MSKVTAAGIHVPDDELRLEVGTVTITARKVVIGNDEPDTPPVERKRRLRNSVLLAVLMLLVTVWFNAHMKTLVAGTLLLGTATLWTVFQAIVTALSRPVEKETDALRKRLLAHPHATLHLGFFIAMAVGLFVTTSSVHVRLGGGDPPVHIRVLEGGRAGVIPSIRLSDDVKVAGAPMQAGFPRRRIHLQVVQPAGYHTLPVTLFTGESAHLVFPDDFERQTLVRIYVPYALAMNVPAVGADKHNATVLTIEANGIRSRVGPYAGGAVYLGVKDVQAATALAESKRAEFDLKQHARLDARAERSDLAAYLAEMHQGQKVLPHWNLNRKHTVTARVEIEGAAVLTCSVRVVDTTIADCAMKEIVK